MTSATSALPTRSSGTHRLGATKSFFKIEWSDTVEGDPAKVDEIRTLMDEKIGLMLRHRFFWACQSGALSRDQIIEILEQIYSFWILFERLLARRISGYSSHRYPELLEAAQRHLKEEFGKADMIRQCLIDNGVTPEELQHIQPSTFTRAASGYLIATLEYENELVSNLAIMQVMESIRIYIIEATLYIMQVRHLNLSVLELVKGDDKRVNTGINFYSFLDDRSLADSKRIIEDLFHIMKFTFDDWLDKC
jgi:hypothetical protein